MDLHPDKVCGACPALPSPCQVPLLLMPPGRPSRWGCAGACRRGQPQAPHAPAQAATVAGPERCVGPHGPRCHAAPAGPVPQLPGHLPDMCAGRRARQLACRGLPEEHLCECWTPGEVAAVLQCSITLMSALLPMLASCTDGCRLPSFHLPSIMHLKDSADHSKCNLVLASFTSASMCMHACMYAWVHVRALMRAFSDRRGSHKLTGQDCIGCRAGSTPSRACKLW